MKNKQEILRRLSSHITSHNERLFLPTELVMEQIFMILYPVCYFHLGNCKCLSILLILGLFTGR